MLTFTEDFNGVLAMTLQPSENSGVILALRFYVAVRPLAPHGKPKGMDKPPSYPFLPASSLLSV